MQLAHLIVVSTAVAISMAASLACSQEAGGWSAEETVRLLRELDDDHAPGRSAAFEKLRSSGDPHVVSRLQGALRKLREEWLKRCRSERKRAARALLGRYDARATARLRREASRLLEKGEVGPMKAAVRELWKRVYFDSRAADRDSGVAAAKERVLEHQSRLAQLGVDALEKPELRIRTVFQEVDEELILERMGSTDRSTVKGNRSHRKRLGLEEQRLVFLTNQYRVLMGRRALPINVPLCEAAREHSRAMKERGFFAHRSPVPGRETPRDRAAAHGTTCTSENIARGGSAEAAFWSWFASVEHHRNMLERWRQIGVGMHEDYWTEMF